MPCVVAACGIKSPDLRLRGIRGDQRTGATGRGDQGRARHRTVYNCDMGHQGLMLDDSPRVRGDWGHHVGR